MSRYTGSPRTVTYSIPATNVGGVFYPGSLMDDRGANDLVWLASGVITEIGYVIDSNDKILDVYDFHSPVTGKPLANALPYQSDAGSNKEALEGPAGAEIFEVFAASGGNDDRDAFITTNGYRVASFRKKSAAVESVPIYTGDGLVCPHGMALIVDTPATTGGSVLTVTYIPWALGAHRKKVADNFAASVIGGVPLVN